MKYFAILALIIMALISFQSFRANPLGDSELKVILKGKNSDNKKLRESFNKVLTRMGKNQSPPATDNLQNLDAVEIYDQFKKRWKRDRDASIEYIRSAFFHDKVGRDVKEQLLEKLDQGNFSREELAYISREIIGRPYEVDPELFRKALFIHGELLTTDRKKRLVKELLERTTDPELVNVVRDYQEGLEGL